VRTLVVAIGNSLRADDGVAHRVADLLTGLTLRRVHQLTPELAAEMQQADMVVFLDADPAADAPSLERIEAAAETGSLPFHDSRDGCHHGRAPLRIPR
jgi:Ni,Fe-hydrogenase maturation factor